MSKKKQLRLKCLEQKAIIYCMSEQLNDSVGCPLEVLGDEFYSTHPCGMYAAPDWCKISHTADYYGDVDYHCAAEDSQLCWARWFEYVCSEYKHKNTVRPAYVNTVKIVSAAIKYADGCIVSMSRPTRHHTIINTHTADGEYEQGFLTSDGLFVGREEALVIAKSAGQIVRRVGGDDIHVFSENLW